MQRDLRRKLEMRFLKRLPAATLLVLVGLFSLVSCCLWVGLVFPVVDYLSVIPADRWAVLEGLSAAAALAFAVGAGIVVLMELNATVDSRNLDIYRDIYEKLMSENEIKARKYIYQSIPASDDKQVVIDAVLGDDQARKHVKRVLNLIDYFGFLVEQEWVTADEVIGWMSPIVVKVWEKIEPVVEYECSQRPEEPDYYESAIRLAERCRKWRDTNLRHRQIEISFNEERL